MSVIGKSSMYYILDHYLWIVDYYKHSKMLDVKLEEMSKLFNLKIPYLMDSQARRIGKQLIEDQNNIQSLETTTKKSRKGRKLNISENEDDLELKHIREVFSLLREDKNFNSIFHNKTTAEDYFDNNSILREARIRILNLTDLPQLQVVGENPSDEPVIHNHNDHDYIIPPRSKYICNVVQNISKLLKDKYDIIVMDPPWYNKYVRRKRKHDGSHQGYDMMYMSTIMNIPIGDYVSKDALVLIWVTNNSSLTQELINKLYLWDLKYVTTWYWLKITVSGEPVVHLGGHNNGKKCYERLIIAQKQSSSKYNIPSGVVLTSVPSGIPSHKPPLNEILKEFLPVHSLNCLEIFARSLIPGWTSIGNEVLRLQHVSNFT